MIYISFISVLGLFLIIGLLSITKSKKTTEDYLLAGKSVPAILVGLSAVATNNSGFMFIGMIGLTYAMGLSSIWLMIGWIVGDFIASMLALRHIQHVSQKENIQSFGGLLAHWHHHPLKKLKIISGIFTIFFLTIYAASQLLAGSKAASVLLNWPIEYGIMISAAIILAYSLVGGLRASIWTDVAQSIVMIVGMVLLFLSMLMQNEHSLIDRLSNVESGYMNFFPEGNILHIGLFILGWLFGGIAIIGQPHVVIRFMSLDKNAGINRMRFYYYSWFILFYGLTIAVGLLSRLAIPETNNFDPELALPTMALALMPEILVGVILAAMFAATMSTADSLILACSASLTKDILPGSKYTLKITKLATFVILIAAVIIAVSNNKTVFSLVLDAWGMLGSAFVPLILIYAFKQKIPEWLAISMVLIGPFVFIIWNHLGLSGLIYSAAPGILSGLIMFGIYHLIQKIKPNQLTIKQ